MCAGIVWKRFGTRCLWCCRRMCCLPEASMKISAGEMKTPAMKRCRESADSTSAVDTRTDALIRQAFREEIPDTTKIIIAQRISSVEDADMIIVMENGEINGIGTSEELLKTNAIYREVYESQLKGGEDDE